MKQLRSVFVVTCSLLVSGIRPALSQSTPAPARALRTAILDLRAINKMPDDDITEVITKLYQQLRATGEFDVINREQVVQAAGSEVAECESADCAARIGRAVGAEKAFFGDVTKVEIIYELTLHLVDVASGAIERTHTEKVAGHMRDVAKVGVNCAIDALLEAPAVSDYRKGDWKKVRGHGAGGRVMIVLPSHSDSLALQRIPTLPTFGLGIHYDAQFRMKNGMEIHYTPSIEYWTQSGDKGGFLRVQHYAFNLADFRWLFAAPTENTWVFFLGLGPSFILYTDYDPSRVNQYPPDSSFQVHPKFGANVMAGLTRHMPRLGWYMDIGFKAKFWNPSIVTLGVSLTRPFKNRTGQVQQSGAEAPSPHSSPEATPAPPAWEPQSF